MTEVSDLPKTIPYHIAERIQDGIVRWRYRPGSSLREMDLCNEFGSSRSPVREALRLLELQGLVVHSPRRGFRVKEYTDDDLKHLYRLRAKLEGSVIDALMLQNIDNLVETLHGLNEDMRRYANQQGIDGYFSKNIEFHQAIIDYTGSPVLITIMSTINTMSLPIRYMLLSRQFPEGHDYDYHTKILTSIREREFDRARELTEFHIMNNLSKIVAMYRRLIEAQEAPTPVHSRLPVPQG